MSNSTVRLSKDFESVALTVSLEVMLLLARALRKVLHENYSTVTLDDEKFSWLNAIELLGQVAAKQVHRFKNIDEITNLWNSFLDLPETRNLSSEPRAILTAARENSIEFAAQGVSALADIDASNRSAYKTVKRLLNAHRIKRPLPENPVNVYVVHDPEGKEYCAAADHEAGSIRWAFQPKVAHSLCALLTLEHVFAHEYLSHLVPTNSWMDVAFPERWLVVALTRGVVNQDSQSLWTRHLWSLFRAQLIRHVDRENEKRDPNLLVSSAFGSLLAEDSANAIYFMNRPSFWRITKEILDGGDDEETARVTKRIMEDFDPSTTALDGNKLYDINSLLKLIP